MAGELQRLQEMYASGKTLSTSKKFAKLYDQYNASGGNTNLIYTPGATPESAAQEALSNKFATEQSDFMNRYQTAIPTIYNRLSEEQGLPGLMSQAQSSTQMVEDVPSQVKTAGKQFGMSTSRQNARIAGQTAQLAPIAQKAVGQAQFAQDTVSTLFQNEIAPYGVEAGLLASRQALEQTGYTNAQANQLSITLQNMANGAAVSAAEMSNVNALAQLEKQYKLSLQNQLAYYKATGDGGSGSTDDGWGNKG